MRRSLSVAILLLLPGVGLLSAAPIHSASAQENPRPPQGPVRRQPTEEEKEAARKRIGMSVQQQKEIEAVFAASDAAMQEIRTRMGELMRQQWDLFGQYDFDRNAAQSLRKELLGLHRRIMLQQLENEEKIRRILNKEQFEKMRAMMKEQFEKNRQRWGRRPGPPGSNPGGPKPPLF
jgi:Spy/CpxP family protein refolding chaperone